MSVVAALDPREATIPSTPATFAVHIRFLGACLEGGLRSNHWSAACRRDLQSFCPPAVAAGGMKTRPVSSLYSETRFITCLRYARFVKQITDKREPGKTS